VGAADCTVRGLALTNCPDAALRVITAPRCHIYGCHIGVDLAGTTAAPNGRYDIEMWYSPSSVVGGPSRWQRNVLAGGAPGSPTPSDAGLFCAYSDGTLIRGNRFGLARNGMAALGAGNTGVATLLCKGLVIGGTSAGERNLFGGLRTGAALSATQDSRIQGNYFGVGADGSRSFSIQDDCLYLNGCSGNLIGGLSGPERNVFAGSATRGIYCLGAGSVGNRIRGNYFGLNADGAKPRPLFFGIVIGSDAESQWIGGPSVAAGNYFAARWPIRFGLGAGAGSTIQNNRIGLTANGADTTGVEEGISIWGTTVRVLNNTIANVTNTGVLATEAGADPEVYRNAFRNCLAAVRVVSDAQCRLGNLGNASTQDDGGNQFDPTNGTHIHNLTPNYIRAEGNSFGTTSRAAIEANIFDKRDNSSLGRVDFIPLAGGVMPTDAPNLAALSVTVASAVPTKGGAGIVFSLSAPATVSVQVLNLAGRLIRTVTPGQACPQGLNTVTWSGLSDAGRQVPSGWYLVEVRALTASSAQSRAVTTLQIVR
jgi:hypothetical protein